MAIIIDYINLVNKKGHNSKEAQAFAKKYETDKIWCKRFKVMNKLFELREHLK